MAVSVMGVDRPAVRLWGGVETGPVAAGAAQAGGGGGRRSRRVSGGGKLESAVVRERARSRPARGGEEVCGRSNRGADFAGCGRRLSSHATLGGERGLKISTWADCAAVGGVDRSARGLCSSVDCGLRTREGVGAVDRRSAARTADRYPSGRRFLLRFISGDSYLEATICPELLSSLSRHGLLESATASLSRAIRLITETVRSGHSAIQSFVESECSFCNLSTFVTAYGILQAL